MTRFWLAAANHWYFEGLSPWPKDWPQNLTGKRVKIPRSHALLRGWSSPEPIRLNAGFTSNALAPSMPVGLLARLVHLYRSTLSILLTIWFQSVSFHVWNAKNTLQACYLFNIHHFLVD